MSDLSAARRAGMSTLIAIGLGVIVLGMSLACSRATKTNQEAAPMKPIEEVLEAHKDSLMALEGVEGVGQGECDGEPCLRVFASRKTPDVEALPDSIEGYAVDVEVTGMFGPRSTP